MLLGEKIKYCRKRNGLNQADFANILNISLEEVQKWESNTVIPELDKLIEISNILDVSLDFLLKESQKEEKSNLNTKSEKPHIGHAIAQHEKHLSENKIKAIKGWMIIGCVLTPLVTGASYINNQYKPESLLFLLMYIFTIPLCVMSIKKCREAKSKSDLIGFGIVSLLVISFIAGLLMITIRDEDFIDDTFKIQPKINAANNKILSAKLLAKNQKKKEKKLTISKKIKLM